MSLINKMLVDLEARRDAPAIDVPVKPIFDDLRPSMGMAPTRRVPPLAVAVVVVATAAGGFFAWRQWQAVEPVIPLAAPQPAAAQAPPHAAPVAPVIPAPMVAAVPVAPTPAVAATTPMADTSAVAAPPTPVVATAPPPVPAPVIAPAPPAATVAAPRPAATPARATPKPVAASKPKAEVVAAIPDAEPTLIDKKERVQTPQQKAENAYRTALAQLKQRQLAQAEPNLRAALSDYPAHTQAREMLAGLLLETARWSEATELLARGLETIPTHYAFAQLLARVYVEHGMEAKALATLESAQAHATRDADYRGFLATLYQRAGRHVEAANHYRDALALRPYEAKWWLGLGISLEAERNWAAADEAYTRAQEAGGLTPALKRYIDERLQAVKARK